MTYHAKLIKGGKVVIPAILRRLFELQDGDSLVFEHEDDKIIIRPRAEALRELQTKAQARLKRPFSMEGYLQEKWAEAERE